MNTPIQSTNLQQMAEALDDAIRASQAQRKALMLPPHEVGFNPLLWEVYTPEVSDVR